MKGSSYSTSSSKLTWFLVQAKKPYWNATNLPEWKVDVAQAAKGAHGIYSVCLVKLKIPSEWRIDEFPMITEAEWVSMIDPQKS